MTCMHLSLTLHAKEAICNCILISQHPHQTSLTSFAIAVLPLYTMLIHEAIFSALLPLLLNLLVLFKSHCLQDIP